jgi:preprotein translocase subunit SecG
MVTPEDGNVLAPVLLVLLLVFVLVLLVLVLGGTGLGLGSLDGGRRESEICK